MMIAKDKNGRDEQGEKGDGTRAEGEQGRELLVTTFASAGNFPPLAILRFKDICFFSFLPFHLFFQTVGVSTTRFRGSEREKIGASGTEWGRDRQSRAHAKHAHIPS